MTSPGYVSTDDVSKASDGCLLAIGATRYQIREDDGNLVVLMTGMVALENIWTPGLRIEVPFREELAQLTLPAYRPSVSFTVLCDRLGLPEARSGTPEYWRLQSCVRALVRGKFIEVHVESGRHRRYYLDTVERAAEQRSAWLPEITKILEGKERS